MFIRGLRTLKTYPSVDSVVGKTKTRLGLIMAKAKTKQWLDKVKALYKPEEAAKLIES